MTSFRRRKTTTISTSPKLPKLRKRRVSEDSVVDAILSYLRKAHPQSHFWKTHGGPYAKSGIADILGCLAPVGHTIAIEVKAPDNKDGVTASQSKFLADVRAAGGIAFDASSLAEAQEKLFFNVGESYR